jgi:hypothetical protein
MTAKDARDWFNKAIQICKLVSDRLGKNGHGEKQAPILTA